MRSDDIPGLKRRYHDDQVDDDEEGAHDVSLPVSNIVSFNGLTCHARTSMVVPTIGRVLRWSLFVFDGQLMIPSSFAEPSSRSEEPFFMKASICSMRDRSNNRSGMVSPVKE